MTYPAPERILADFLTADLGVRVCSEVPADLADVVPLVQAVRVGGPAHDRDPFFLMPTINVDCFDADRASAMDLAHAVDLSLRRRLSGATVLGARIGRVATITGPSWRPWDDTDVRRFGATYQIWIKAPSA